MNMITHETKTVDAMLKPNDSFLQQQKKAITIIVCEKILCPPLPRSITW